MAGGFVLDRNCSKHVGGRVRVEFGDCEVGVKIVKGIVGCSRDGNSQIGVGRRRKPRGGRRKNKGKDIIKKKRDRSK